MAKENRVEFDYVAWNYAKPFADRWEKMVQKSKNADEKQYAFELFISQFIIYAAYVNVIKPKDSKNRIMGSDNVYCTEIMTDLLLEQSNVSYLIERLNDNALEFASVIKNHHYILLSSSDKDPDLYSNWQTGTDRDKLLSLLHSLYYLRCNLFHGTKIFADEQVLLLSPENECSKILNQEIHQVFTNIDRAH